MLLVPPCDVSQCINRTEVTELMFLHRYSLLLAGMYKMWYPAVHFCCLFACWYVLCICCANIKLCKMHCTYNKLDTCIAVSALLLLSDTYIAVYVPCNLCDVWAGMLSFGRGSSWACGITWSSLQLHWLSRIRRAAVSSIECMYFSKCWAVTGKQEFVYRFSYIRVWDQILEGKNCKTLVHFWG